jgi:hypothetical protein
MSAGGAQPTVRTRSQHAGFFAHSVMFPPLGGGEVSTPRTVRATSGPPEPVEVEPAECVHDQRQV